MDHGLREQDPRLRGDRWAALGHLVSRRSAQSGERATLACHPSRSRRIRGALLARLLSFGAEAPRLFDQRPAFGHGETGPPGEKEPTAPSSPEAMCSNEPPVGVPGTRPRLKFRSVGGMSRETPINVQSTGFPA